MREVSLLGSGGILIIIFDNIAICRLNCNESELSPPLCHDILCTYLIDLRRSSYLDQTTSWLMQSNIRSLTIISA